MPRRARVAPGGFVYHVLNRAVARLTLWERRADFEAFDHLIEEALQKHPTRLLAYCTMPTHWHMLIWPREDGERTAFLRWLTHTHVMRWHAHHQTSGTGHLDQGRFRSFPVQVNEHFDTVVRYVESNPLRNALVKHLRLWRWSSLWRREGGRPRAAALLAPWPIPKPAHGPNSVKTPLTEKKLRALRESVPRGRPYGSPRWQRRIARQLGLEGTLRPRGRPRSKRS